MYKKSRLASALLALLLIALAGCGSTNTAPDAQGSADAPAVETPEALLVKTPVGELAFPGEFSDQVRMEEASSDAYHLVRFYGEVAGNPVILFELAFGGDEGVYAVGTAPDASGNQVPIWLNVQALERGDDWTDEETEQMNLLQSCVNDLLEQINALDGFVPAE